jgi:hypothetical protein
MWRRRTLSTESIKNSSTYKQNVNTLQLAEEPVLNVVSRPEQQLPSEIENFHHNQLGDNV